jgi:hypothetical protein
MTPRFATILWRLPKYRARHQEIARGVQSNWRAQLFREAGFGNDDGRLLAKRRLMGAQQKSSSVPLLPENGRYRLSMKSDQSRHRPIGEA